MSDLPTTRESAAHTAHDDAAALDLISAFACFFLVLLLALAAALTLVY